MPDLEQKIDSLVEETNRDYRAWVEKWMATLTSDRSERACGGSSVDDDIAAMHSALEKKLKQPGLKKAVIARIERVVTALADCQKEEKRLQSQLSSLQLVCPHDWAGGGPCYICGKDDSDD